MTGLTCNQCKANTFNLASKNQFGCISCFCMGITDKCVSSNWYRNDVSIFYVAVNEKPTEFYLQNCYETVLFYRFEFHLPIPSGTSLSSSLEHLIVYQSQTVFVWTQSAAKSSTMNSLTVETTMFTTGSCLAFS